MLDFKEKTADTPHVPTGQGKKRTASFHTERRWPPLILASVDLACVYLAFLLAYWTRYGLQIGPHIKDQLPFDAYRPLILPLMALMLVTLWMKGAYRLRMGDEIQDDISSTFSAVTITLAMIVVLESMLQRYQYSRGVIVYLWVTLIALLVIGRWTFRSVIGSLHRRGVGVRRLLVVGATDAGKMIMQGVAARRDLGYELVGFVHTRLESAAHNGGVDRPDPISSLTDFGRFRSLGFATDVPVILQREKVDEVIIALPAAAHEEIWPILQECESKGVGFKIVPDTFELSLGRVQVDDIAGIPLLDVRDQPLRKFKIFIKQLADIAFGFVLAVLFSPVMLITAIAIRLDSPGPLLYRAQRVGLNGRVFTCYKFRSMRENAEELVSDLRPLNDAQGPIFKIKEDPRCTRVGRVIRRHSIDELPQLWNVLRREMSLVGPRPAFPSEVSKYETWQRRRLLSRPGITGMWQVSGRSDLSFDEMVMLDIYYIENWSLILDVKILLRTVAAMVTGRGAY